jgi:hypothetical protein
MKKARAAQHRAEIAAYLYVSPGAAWRRRPHDVIDPRGVQTGERCQGTRCDIARNSVRILRID